MQNQSLLLVDDDVALSTAVSDYLKISGYMVSLVHTAEAAMQALKQRAYNLVILDLTLPDEDGLCVLRKLRQSSDIPVIITSGRSTAEDRISGLEFGSDDYLVKPFSPRELVLRIQKRLLLAQSDKADELKSFVFGDFRFSPESFELNHRINGPVPLTPREYEVLKTLVYKAPRPCSRSELLDAFLEEEGPESGRAIDMIIRRLRSKIETNPSEPAFVVTVKGVGYKLLGVEPDSYANQTLS